MNICSICPVNKSYLMYEESPMVMLLTHLVEKYPSYVEEALKHPDTYKILDNSLIELGGALSMDRLVSAAEKVKANEIILPDVFKDGEATIQSTINAINWLKEHNLLGKYKLMVVCHGTTKEAFKKCFDTLEAMPEIDVIGIPKVMASMSWVKGRNRKDLKDIFMNSSKEIHFLGSWYNLGELLDLGKDVWNRVRSADTCLPSLDVIQGLGFYDDRIGTIDLEEAYIGLTDEKYREFMSKLEKAIVQSYLHVGE